MTKTLKFGLGRVENIVGEKDKKHCGKGRKCWLTAFSPSFRMFTKTFFSGGYKNWDCVVKG